jgi:hypothetical protein
VTTLSRHLTEQSARIAASQASIKAQSLANKPGYSSGNRYRYFGVARWLKFFYKVVEL